MKVLILFGSPRKTGNTAALLKPFMEELQDHEAQIMFLDVYDKQIAGCRVCMKCQDDAEHICCAVDDDMQEILKAVEKADLIVIAAPVYA